MGAMMLTGAIASPASAVNADHGQQIVSDDPANFTPHVTNGSVQAIVQIGSRIVAAGTFTTVRQTPTGPDITRNGIFAFDATTGAIDMGFNPNLGGSAKSLDTDGTYIYVGGSFTSVSGQSSTKRVAKLTADGTLVPGLRNPNAAVNEVVVRGDRIYLGGKFTSIGGGTAQVSRSAFAALDKNTGNVLPDVNLPFAGVFNGGKTGITRMDASPDGTKVVTIGNFLTVAGHAREQIAMIDTPAAGPATVSGWSTARFSRARNSCSQSFDSWMRDIDFSPDGSYFAVTTTGAFAGGAGRGTMCDTSSRWESGRSGSNQEPTWVDYTGGDTTYGVAVTGSAVYVGGHMRWQNNPFQGDHAGPGAVAREGIAALDPLNGLPLSWNPGRAKGVGAEALYATATGLWVGSDTVRIGGEVRQRVAFMPLAGGTSVPQVSEPALPGDLLLAERTPGGSLLRRTVDASGSPVGAAVPANSDLDWSTVRGTFLVNDTLYYGLADGGLYARSFNAVTGAVGPQRAVDLHDDPDDGSRIPFAIANLSGIFYDTSTHRLYYSVTGNPALFYRYFTPESEVVGAQTFQVADTNGITFAGVSGMTLAGGRILYGSTADGALRTVSFSGGTITSGPTVVSSDGTWRFREMFAGPVASPPPPLPNQAPTAAFNVTCDTQRLCSVDASPSSDPDGDLVDFAWQYTDGVGGDGTGMQDSYKYGADGTYTITLTVTDDDGATGVTTRQLEVTSTPPAVADIGFRGAVSASGNLRAVSVQVPSSVQVGDAMILSLSQSTSRAISEPTGGGTWLRIGAQVGNRDEITTTLWQRVAEAGDAGSTVTITLDGFAKVVLALAAYTGTDQSAPVLTSASSAETVSRTTHTTPEASASVPGSWVLSYWTDKSSTTQDWTEPAGEQVRVEDFAPGSGHVSLLLSDSNGPVAEGTRAGITATADSASSKAVMWTLVLRPA
jgi:PKD domain/Domain of unknown function (DUF5122) beta-propeller